MDVAVAVADLASYESLASSLQRSVGRGHLFLVHGVDVDIIPFGGIESPGRSITWPDEMAMDVHGFAEAHRQAVVVKVPGGLEVRVASLAAQSALKILAWRDRRHEGDKDAIDLRTILAAGSEGQTSRISTSGIRDSSSASITTRSWPGPPDSAPARLHCSTRTAGQSWSSPRTRRRPPCSRRAHRRELESQRRDARRLPPRLRHRESVTVRRVHDARGVVSEWSVESAE